MDDLHPPETAWSRFRVPFDASAVEGFSAWSPKVRSGGFRR